jgi:hypothetical protein
LTCFFKAVPCAIRFFAEFSELLEQISARLYEAVLNKEPNRYRAVLGAARAASRAGNAARRSLARLWQGWRDQ